MLSWEYKQRLNMLVEIETESEGNVVLLDFVVSEEWTQIVFDIQTRCFITDIGACSVDKIVDVEIAFGFLSDIVAVFVFIT